MEHQQQQPENYYLHNNNNSSRNNCNIREDNINYDTLNSDPQKIIDSESSELHSSTGNIIEMESLSSQTRSDSPLLHEAFNESSKSNILLTYDDVDRSNDPDSCNTPLLDDLIHTRQNRMNEEDEDDYMEDSDSIEHESQRIIDEASKKLSVARKFLDESDQEFSQTNAWLNEQAEKQRKHSLQSLDMQYSQIRNRSDKNDLKLLQRFDSLMEDNYNTIQNSPKFLKYDIEGETKRKIVPVDQRLAQIEHNLNEMSNYDVGGAEKFKTIRYCLNDLNDRSTRHNSMIERFSSVKLDSDINDNTSNRIERRCENIMRQQDIGRLNGSFLGNLTNSSRHEVHAESKLIPGYSTLESFAKPSNQTTELRSRIRNLLKKTSSVT